VNASANNVAITSITETTRRRLNMRGGDAPNTLSFMESLLLGGTSVGMGLEKGMHSTHSTHNVHTMAAGIAVTVQVSLVLERLGYTADQGSVLYTHVSTTLSSAVTGGTFGSTLAEKLSDAGSTTTLVADTSSLVVGNYTTTTSVDSDSDDDSEDSTTLIIIIVVVVGVFALAVVVCCLLYSRNNKALPA
jgi:hypothetical protein